MCVVEKSLNLLEEEKLHEEKKKCLILYDNNYMTKIIWQKGYMAKDVNCLSAKGYLETNIVFCSYVILFKFFVDFFFKKVWKISMYVW